MSRVLSFTVQLVETVQYSYYTRHGCETPQLGAKPSGTRLQVYQDKKKTGLRGRAVALSSIYS